MDVAAVVDGVRQRLAAVGSPDRAEHERAYLKSDLAFLGASVPQVRAEATRVHRAHPALDHDELVALVEGCWAAAVHELRLAAVELLRLRRDLLAPADVALLERLLREARTWALVDVLAAGVVGDLLDRFPGTMDPVVRRWAVDEDMWVRRAALLAHLGAIRRGEADLDRVGELADGMLEEREFFIRKAIGWVLRDAGRRRPDWVVAWLEPRVDRAAGLTVREAVTHLPVDHRDRLLARSRQRPRRM